MYLNVSTRSYVTPEADALLLEGCGCLLSTRHPSEPHSHLRRGHNKSSREGDRGNYHNISVDIQCHSTKLIASVICNHCIIVRVFCTCVMLFYKKLRPGTLLRSFYGHAYISNKCRRKK